jgi:uncharacterized membrane protein YgcG
VRPLTGAPQIRGGQAQWEGVNYASRATYTAKVTWVQGEFYWRVQRDERALVTDYHGVGAASRKRLSREQTGNEVTWSAGEAIDAAVLAKAFGVPIASQPGFPTDSSMLSNALGKRSLKGTPTLVWIVVAFIVLIVILDACSDDCDDVRSTFGTSSAEYQQCKRSGGSGVRSGGSSGGWSSGGGHK